MATIAVNGGTFNPPGNHHVRIAEAVASLDWVDEVVMPQCGLRPDKEETRDIEPVHRHAMCQLAFGHIRGVRLDPYDLVHGVFTRQAKLHERYAVHGDDVWHVIGADLVPDIRATWTNGNELWHKLQFIIVLREDYDLDMHDLPPRHRIIRVDDGAKGGLAGASKDIRLKIFKREDYAHLVPPAVHSYIERYGLFRTVSRKTTSLRLAEPRPLFVVDTRNPKAVAYAEKYRHLAVEANDSPNLVATFGGDGHLLDSVHNYHHLRLPFVGVNQGHEGYLLNDESVYGTLPELLADLRVYLQMQLDVEMLSDKHEAVREYAFNDAWVRDLGQAAWLDIIADGGEKWSVSGDGVLYCTPAGSTGYAWSMGAFPLSVDADHNLLVGNNLYRPRGWKCMNLRRETSLEIISTGGTKRPLNGWIDGRLVEHVVRMKCSTSPIAGVELAFSPKRDLWAKLRDKSAPRRDTSY